MNKMRLKPIFLTLALATSFLVVQAQKKPKARYQASRWVYHRLPLKPLPANIKTYWSKVKVKDGDIRDEPQDLAENYLEIGGLKRTRETPDLLILVTLKGFEVEKKKLKWRTKGSLANARKVYYYRYSCLYPMKIKITTKAGKEIYTRTLAGPDRVFSYDAKAFATEAQAEEDYSENRRKHKRLAEKSIRQKLFGGITEILKSNYAKTNLDVQLQAGFAKGSKKRFDFSDIDKAKTSLQQAIGKLNSDDVEEANADLKVVINICEKALTESKVDDKRARVNRKVTAMLHYNCGLAHFLMNNFKQAGKHLNKAKDIASKIGGILSSDATATYATRLSRLMADKKNRMQANSKQ